MTVDIQYIPPLYCYTGTFYNCHYIRGSVVNGDCLFGDLTLSLLTLKMEETENIINDIKTSFSCFQNCVRYFYEIT